MSDGELVFISANRADNEHAEIVFDFLEAHGVHAFLSQRSLPELGNSDYRKVIDERLDSCSHMVVVTSSRERVESPWVEAEWGFFINAKRSRSKTGNIITMTTGDLAPRDLPPSLRYYEVIPLTPTSLDRLLKYVARPAAAAPQNPTDRRTGAEPRSCVPKEPNASDAIWQRVQPGSCGARIKIFGVGNGGTAVLNLIINEPYAATVLVTSDPHAASESRATVTLLIGSELTSGLGAGDNPERAREAAEHAADRLRRELVDCDFAMFSAGLGGGTGTGATPVLAKIARELGVVTVCFVTMPFGFEGPRRAQRAGETLALLQDLCDVVIPIPGDQALQLAADSMVSEAFAAVARLHCRWVTALREVVENPGAVNIDVADLRVLFRNSGIAAIGQGEGRGANRAREAVRMALSSGYLSALPIPFAGSALLILEGGSDLSISDLSGAADALYEAANRAEIICGSRIDPNPGDTLRAIVFATRFPKEC